MYAMKILDGFWILMESALLRYPFKVSLAGERVQLEKAIMVSLQYHEWMVSIISRSLCCLLQFFWYIIHVILFLHINSSSILVDVSITTGMFLSFQRALACWGKSKLEARHQQEVTSVPLEQGGLKGANPLTLLDILRAIAREKETQKPGKMPIKT